MKSIIYQVNSLNLTELKLKINKKIKLRNLSFMVDMDV